MIIQQNRQSPHYIKNSNKKSLVINKVGSEVLVVSYFANFTS